MAANIRHSTETNEHDTRADTFALACTPATVLVADPAWKHSDKLPGPGRGAVKHYAGGTMAVEDIMRFPLPELDPSGAWLFLWRLHTHHNEALDVAQAWGFGRKPCSELVWVKTTLDNSRVRIGMGRSLRMAHETCLIFKRGRPHLDSRAIPSAFLAPRLEHSAKPEAFYEVVERFAGPEATKVELFARRERRGWRTYGDELHCSAPPQRRQSR